MANFTTKPNLLYEKMTINKKAIKNERENIDVFCSPIKYLIIFYGSPWVFYSELSFLLLLIKFHFLPVKSSSSYNQNPFSVLKYSQKRFCVHERRQSANRFVLKTQKRKKNYVALINYLKNISIENIRVKQKYPYELCANANTQWQQALQKLKLCPLRASYSC